MNITKLFFDCETTGLNTKTEEIIEIAALFDSNVSFESLINPQKQIPEIITELIGIRDRDVEDAPKFDEAMDKFFEWIAENNKDNKEIHLIAHNGHRFDFPILEHCALRYKYPLEEQFKKHNIVGTVDTLKIARSLPERKKKSNKLSTLCTDYAIEIDQSKLHRALYDVECLAKLCTMESIVSQLSKRKFVNLL